MHCVWRFARCLVGPVLCVVLFLSIPTSFAHAYSYSGEHWATASTYWGFSNPFPLTSAQQTAAVAAASTWNGAGSKWRFVRDEIKADVLGWTIAAADLGSGQGVAVTSYSIDAKTKHVLYCSTFINTHYPFSTTGASTSFDVQSVMTHEFGHWLVLNDLRRATDSEKTMYYQIGKGETKKRSLHSDDIAGVRGIYGK